MLRSMMRNTNMITKRTGIQMAAFSPCDKTYGRNQGWSLSIDPELHKYRRSHCVLIQ